MEGHSECDRLYSSPMNHTLKAVGSSQHPMNAPYCICSVSSSLTNPVVVFVFVMSDIEFVTTAIHRHRYRLTFRTPLCCLNGSLVHITIAPVSFPQVYTRLQILPLKGALATSERRHPQSAVSVTTDPIVAFPHRLRTRTTRTYTHDVHVQIRYTRTRTTHVRYTRTHTTHVPYTHTRTI